ncbi:hypothetical protein A3B18_01985 [Candidatus Giovannonibacteria bacterium RIFCSPLOWO2_01_FULL_46_13]|uniref:Uncharacterized protein n=1 Tax=Candidatus Giovannonibacteria bacterium RIFCSPLOWO2_01_FULL_46_13 TaxID=1798352 RepID=A0A1F5X2T4_9BACT|nr:MAG: hypothetical protein A3B18_01985 [Candidatus Giovannonibacteria bacterium RIFCSPLOWO2_01_FULL_46_13]
MKEVVMLAKMLLDDSGKECKGFTLESISEEGKRLIDDFISGSVKGLPYCKNAVVSPYAGGAGRYCFQIKEK